MTVRHEYTDDDGELVGVGRMRLLKFRPPQEPGEEPGDGHDEQEPDLADPSRRPGPPVNRDNRFFWDGVAEGRLLVQRCGGCGTRRHPPRPMCGRCRSTEWEPEEISGRGTLHSYVVHHHPPLPGFELPHPVALVDLEEDRLRLVAETAGVDPDDLEIGMPVRVVVEDVAEELTVPVVRPREAP